MLHWSLHVAQKTPEDDGSNDSDATQFFPHIAQENDLPSQDIKNLEDLSQADAPAEEEVIPHAKLDDPPIRRTWLGNASRTRSEVQGEMDCPDTQCVTTEDFEGSQWNTKQGNQIFESKGSSVVLGYHPDLPNTYYLISDDLPDTLPTSNCAGDIAGDLAIECSTNEDANEMAGQNLFGAHIFPMLGEEEIMECFNNNKSLFEEGSVDNIIASLENMSFCTKEITSSGTAFQTQVSDTVNIPDSPLGPCLRQNKRKLSVLRNSPEQKFGRPVKADENEKVASLYSRLKQIRYTVKDMLCGFKSPIAPSTAECLREEVASAWECLLEFDAQKKKPRVKQKEHEEAIQVAETLLHQLRVLATDPAGIMNDFNQADTEPGILGSNTIAKRSNNGGCTKIRGLSRRQPREQKFRRCKSVKKSYSRKLHKKSPHAIKQYRQRKVKCELNTTLCGSMLLPEKTSCLKKESADRGQESRSLQQSPTLTCLEHKNKGMDSIHKKKRMRLDYINHGFQEEKKNTAANMTALSTYHSNCKVGDTETQWQQASHIFPVHPERKSSNDALCILNNQFLTHEKNAKSPQDKYQPHHKDLKESKRIQTCVHPTVAHSLETEFGKMTRGYVDTSQMGFANVGEKTSCEGSLNENIESNEIFRSDECHKKKDKTEIEISSMKQQSTTEISKCLTDWVDSDATHFNPVQGSVQSVLATKCKAGLELVINNGASSEQVTPMRVARTVDPDSDATHLTTVLGSAQVYGQFIHATKCSAELQLMTNNGGNLQQVPPARSTRTLHLDSDATHYTPDISSAQVNVQQATICGAKNQLMANNDGNAGHVTPARFERTVPLDSETTCASKPVTISPSILPRDPVHSINNKQTDLCAKTKFVFVCLGGDTSVNDICLPKASELFSVADLPSNFWGDPYALIPAECIKDCDWDK